MKEKEVGGERERERGRRREGRRRRVMKNRCQKVRGGKGASVCKMNHYMIKN